MNATYNITDDSLSEMNKAEIVEDFKTNGAGNLATANKEERAAYILGMPRFSEMEDGTVVTRETIALFVNQFGLV